MSDSNSNIPFVFKVASRARGRVGVLRPTLVCLLTAVGQAKADEFKVSVGAAIPGQHVGPRTQVAEDPVTESLSLQDGGHCEWGGFEGDWSAHASVSASAGAGGLSLQSHVKAVQPRACGGIDAMASSLSSMTIGDIVIMQTAGPPVGSVKGRLRLKAAGSAETRGWDTCGTGRGARVELNARIEINSLPLDGGAIYCRDGNAPEYSGVFAGENRELTLYVGSPLTIRIMVTHVCDAVGCGPNREVTNEALLTTNLALDPDIFELPPGFEVRSLKGACCLPPDETCRPRTEQRCASQQGRFLGVGTTCADAPCTKSCCLPDGSCAVLSEAECSARQGTYRPDDPSCENPCPGTTGACCLLAGGCEDLTEAECANRDGAYSGDGTTCLVDAECADVLRWTNPAGGAWNIAENWDPQRLPRSVDAVVFDLPLDAPPYPIRLFSAAAKAASVREGAFAFSGGAIELTTAEPVALAFADVPDTRGSSQTMSVAEGGFIGQTGGMTVASDPNADAYLSIQPGGLLQFTGTPESAFRAATVSGSSARITVNGGGVLEASKIDLGGGGTAELRIEADDARVAARSLEIGRGGRLHGGLARVGARATGGGVSLGIGEQLAIRDGGRVQAILMRIDAEGLESPRPTVEISGLDDRHPAELITSVLRIGDKLSGSLKIVNGGRVEGARRVGQHRLLRQVPAKVFRQGVHRLVALWRFLGQGLEHDRIQFAIQSMVVRRGCRWLVALWWS